MEVPINCTFGGVFFSSPGRLEDLLHHGHLLPQRDLEEVAAIFGLRRYMIHNGTEVSYYNLIVNFLATE
jgi:hypothetical protein